MLRASIAVGVVILALAVVLPTVRVYMDRQQELHALREEVAQAREEVDDLEAEVARWDDPAFIVAQSRERLSYVFPGETPYRVIDPEFVTTHVDGSPASERSTEAVGEGIWYELLWESVVVAGNGEPDDADEEKSEEDDDVEVLTDIDFGG